MYLLDFCDGENHSASGRFLRSTSSKLGVTGSNPVGVANDFNRVSLAQGRHSDTVSAVHSDKIRTKRERSSTEASARTVVDQLDAALGDVRPFLDRSTPVGNRLRRLWAGVVTARDLGTSDIVEGEFFRLAHETGLFADLGRHADEDLRHVIRWAMLDRNPF